MSPVEYLSTSPMTPKTTTSMGFKESQYEPSVALDRPVLNGWIDTRDDARRRASHGDDDDDDDDDDANDANDASPERASSCVSERRGEVRRVSSRPATDRSASRRRDETDDGARDDGARDGGASEFETRWTSVDERRRGMDRSARGDVDARGG